MSFDDASINYLKSSDHKFGSDIEYITNYFGKNDFQYHLDIATAAGHFCRFFNSKTKVVSDLSFNMLKTASKNFNFDFYIQNKAEYLPFKSELFDLVTCRIALHHFTNPELFFKEVYRCLIDGGMFVLIDSIVDVDDTYLNAIEFVRDDSHIRSYTFFEIAEFTKNIFRLENFNLIYKKHDFAEWSTRLNNTKENVKKVENLFFDLPENVKSELAVEINKNKVISYTDKKGIFIFKKI
jgi:ubiquinone/menaquinone biosynthesis C-methylase UbiE